MPLSRSDFFRSASKPSLLPPADATMGIARALYRDPEILVFDEATSSLDTIAERDLTNEINRLRGRMTMIIVTHRLSTIVACDKIYVISKGVVVESGTHEELVARSVLYRQLNSSQDQIGDPSEEIRRS
jgi:ABC-type multidrug transport system fused ATPase/permease subunit